MSDVTNTALRHGIYNRTFPQGSNDHLVNMGMYVNGVEYDADSIAELLVGIKSAEEQIQEAQSRIRTVGHAAEQFRSSVRSVIVQAVTDEDLEREHANALLIEMGLEPAEMEYEATITVVVRARMKSLENEIDVHDRLVSAVDVDVSMFDHKIEDFEVIETDVDGVEVEEVTT